MLYRWLLILPLFASLLPAADTDPLPPPSPEALAKYGPAATILIGKLTDVKAGPVGLSEPPLYNHRLTFAVESVLKGTAKKGENLVATHMIRQKMEPTFPVGERVIATLQKSRGGVTVSSVEKYDDKLLATIKSVLLVPVGWTTIKGGYVSPWATLEKPWPSDSKLTSSIKCARTGRPALRVGEGVDYRVEAVKPKVAVKFANPDGDGEYQITVTNPGKAPVEVPALLTDGKTVLWKECLIIQSQGKTYPLPGASGIKGEVRPVTLKPGESLSTTVQALALNGPEWPRGGYRIELTFALGEKAQTMSLYYLSKHHDPIRAAAQAEKAKP